MQTPFQRKVQPLLDFGRDGKQFLVRCTKPNRREMIHMTGMTGVALFGLGFMGFMIRLIQIPISQILLS